MVLADANSSDCEGLRALAIAREKQPNIPFVFVSDWRGDRQVAEALQAGATDFILKQHLPKLAPCIRRTIETKRMQRALQRARAD